MPLYHKSAASRTQLSLFHRSLMQSDGCPMRSLLSDQRIAEIFRDEGIVFGEDEEAVYTPLMTSWGLLRAAMTSGRACRSMSLTATCRRAATSGLRMPSKAWTTECGNSSRSISRP